MRKIVPLLLVTCLTGCWAPRSPETEFSINPISKTMRFHDTKDNDVEITGAGFNTITHDFKLDKLTIHNNASAVIREQVEQMKVWNEQMRTANEAILGIVQQLSNMVNVLAPGLNSRLSRPTSLFDVAKTGVEAFARPSASQPTN